MAEENQVEPQQITKEPQQISKEPQQISKEPQQVTKEPQGEAAQRVTKEPQRVTAKNPKKVEAGKRLAESNCKKREAKKKRTSEIGGQRCKPVLWNWGCYSSGSYRWSWLLHLSNQERRATK